MSKEIDVEFKDLIKKCPKKESKYKKIIGVFVGLVIITIIVTSILAIIGFRESLYGLIKDFVESTEMTPLYELIKGFIFTKGEPPYIILIAIGLLTTLVWRVARAENQLRNKLIELFNNSFVLAYYSQYAFLREIARRNDGLYMLDENIDEFVQEPIEYPKSLGRIFEKGKKIEFNKESDLGVKYDDFRNEIDMSRYNAGKMLATIRIELGDEVFANEYREYMKHARKTSYLIGRIFEEENNFKNNMEDAIFSLHTSDQIKQNFEKKLRHHSIHSNIIKKFFKSMLSKLPCGDYLVIKIPAKISIKKHDPVPKIICHEKLSEFSFWMCLEKYIIKEWEKKRIPFGISYRPEIHKLYDETGKKPHMVIFEKGENVRYNDLTKYSCVNCSSPLKMFRKELPTFHIYNQIYQFDSKFSTMQDDFSEINFINESKK